MELLIGVASLVVGFAITALSVKLAARWLGAEHSGWGRAVGALLLSYLAVAILGVLAGVIGVTLPGTVGLGVTVAAVLVMFVAPVVIFARVLGTTALRAAGILIISILVNIGISLAIGVVLALALGVGLAGVTSMLAIFTAFNGDAPIATDADLMSRLPPGVADGSALDRVEADVEKLCACSSDECLDAVFPGLMDALGEASMSGPIVDGEPDATARLEGYFARIDECGQSKETVVAEADASADASLIDEVDDVASSAAPNELTREDTGTDPGDAADDEPIIEAGDDAPAIAADEAAIAIQPTAAPPDAIIPVEAVEEPAPAAAARQGMAPSSDLITYYVLRDINVDDAGSHLGKLARVTLEDGRRFSDQLIAIENNALVLKRDGSAGGGSYAIKQADVARLEVLGP